VVFLSNPECEVNLTAETAAAPAANPLLEPWTGPYGGVPPFDRVAVEHFVPALEAAMQARLDEVDRIVADSEPPSFANTIEALERSGRRFDRVVAVYGVWSTTRSDAAFQAVEREMAPRMAAFADRIVQNEPLFRRIETVHDAADGAGLTPEQRRLVWLYHSSFVRSGARLGVDEKARLSQINQELASLFTRFNQNVLGDETEQYLLLGEEGELAGLPRSEREAAAEAAAAHGHEGAWLIANTRSAMEPFLTYADRRDLRERAWRLFVSRGDGGGERDNNEIVSRILALRAERAALLGYPTHAHWRLEKSMAGTPERALELMEAVWTPAAERVREEVAEMREVVDDAGDAFVIEPWDYRYYAERLRKRRYDVDDDEVKQFLQLDRMVDSMFWVAEELFGMAFSPVDNVPVYHPDVRVWEVTRRDDDRHLGLFYFDPFARDGKRSGAWMNAYRRQERFDGEVTTIVSNNSNFMRGRAGEPVLISWTDATTLFHEFGHALHGLASDVNYPYVAGTNVFRDYVEFPSQLLEHWLSTPEVLERFAVHVETGEPIPPALVERIRRASLFNEGFGTVEYLGSGLVDMRMHLAGDRPIDPPTFERETLEALGMPREIVMRHRPTHFAHVFGGDGYSAAYYSYLWADVLTADAAEAFIEAGGFFDRDVAGRLLRHVLSAGNTVDPAEAYRAFRGRDPEVGALMRKRGFRPAAGAEA
jgi:peptidyl-dipeptidase Dcp